MGTLAHMIAAMPSWIAMMLNQDELDIAPKDGPTQSREPGSRQQLLQGLEDGAEQSRKALREVEETKLFTDWKLLAGGQWMSQGTRYKFIRDPFTRLAHHRGQLTVYLRLNEATVPATYGPSADDQRF